jgi:23S rRNA (adenine2503-C2)-methyltransferase
MPAALTSELTTLPELLATLRRLGAQPVHIQRVLRLWTHALPIGTGRRKVVDFLPAPLLAALPELLAALESLVVLRSQHQGEDGSARLLGGLHDGQTVESVLLPREGLCISSQVGCAVGCRFCMTGTEGLIRQVGSAEMVAQVALARRQRVVKKVVFMGMGEPAHNLENVLDAAELLGTVGNIGHKNIVISSVGDERLFARLSERLRPVPGGPVVKPALALSLHTTRADLRAELLPRAPRLHPEDLVNAAEAYARASGYPVQYQWTLLAGVNDSDEEIEGIVRLLGGRYGVLNLIPYNTVDGLPFARPSWEQAADMARRLHRRGILTKLRHSAGQDVEGGCGQLRAREAAGRPGRAEAVVQWHAPARAS